MTSRQPLILYNSPHVPAEWMAAHDCLPCRITPQRGATHTYPGMGVCPYAAALIGEAAHHVGASGIVLTTSCDQMRRQAEILEEMTDCPVFLMHIPTAVHAPTARVLYREEVLRLGRFMERVGGVAPTMTHLAAVMARYDDARRRLRAMGESLCGKAFSAAVMQFQRGDWSVLDMPPPEPVAGTGIPLALTGGPLRMSDFCLFDEVAEAGGRIVLDATGTGERALPPSFDTAMMGEYPLARLVEAYLGIPDAFQRPNTGFHAYLRSALPQRGARGIILRHYVWCDTWQMEAARLEDATGLPVLRLDAGEEDDSMRQAGRIRAFLEMLS